MLEIKLIVLVPKLCLDGRSASNCLVCTRMKTQQQVTHSFILIIRGTHMQTQQARVRAILSNNTEVETKPAVSVPNQALEQAAQTLQSYYMNNQELTVFTCLDGEDFLTKR